METGGNRPVDKKYGAGYNQKELASSGKVLVKHMERKRKSEEQDITIEERVSNAKLTQKDKTVLDYMMSNQEFACFQTSNEIAEKLSVSPSSVVRLSSKLGYENFAQMKRVLQEQVAGKRKKSPESREIPYEKIKQADKLTDRELVEAIRQNISGNLQKDLVSMDVSRYLKAAKVISEAERVFVVGYRACAGFASSMGVMMECIRPKVYIVSNNVPMIDFLVDIGPSDVVVAISYERYSSDTIFAVKMAYKAGSRVVSLTDSYASPIAEGAEVVIVNRVDNFNFHNSYVGLTMSMEILIGLLSKYNKSLNEQRLIKMEEFLKETGQY